MQLIFWAFSFTLKLFVQLLVTLSSTRFTRCIIHTQPHSVSFTEHKMPVIPCMLDKDTFVNWLDPSLLSPRSPSPEWNASLRVLPLSGRDPACRGKQVPSRLGTVRHRKSPFFFYSLKWISDGYIISVLPDPLSEDLTSRRVTFMQSVDATQEPAISLEPSDQLAGSFLAKDVSVQATEPLLPGWVHSLCPTIDQAADSPEMPPRHYEWPPQQTDSHPQKKKTSVRWPLRFVLSCAGDKRSFSVFTSGPREVNDESEDQPACEASGASFDFTVEQAAAA